MKDKIVVYPGEILKGFYFVEKGRVACVKYSYMGKEKVKFIMDKSSSFLESNVIFDVPSFSYFMTLEDSELIFIKKDDILKLLKTDYEVVCFILKSITAKFYAAVGEVDDMIFCDTESRICKLLINMAKSYGISKDNEIVLDFNITQQFISDVLGIHRITALRILKKLKKMKYIEQTKEHYIIKDLEGLKNYKNIHSTLKIFN